MTKNKKAKISISIVIIASIALFAFLVGVYWLSQTTNSFSSFRGYDLGIKHAEENNNFLPINLTEQLNEDYSLTLDNVYLGIKRIIISYTLNCKSGEIPSGYKNEEVSSRCSISIDDKKYDNVEVTLASSVTENAMLKGALLLDASNYGTDFVLLKNSAFRVSFINLMDLNKDINFKFNVTNKPNFLSNQVDYSFEYNNKKHHVQSIELDSTTTTLNFSKPTNIKDIKIVQGGKEYGVITISNKNKDQYYISFPAIERGIPFTVYIGDMKKVGGERIFTHTFD